MRRRGSPIAVALCLVIVGGVLVSVVATSVLIHRARHVHVPLFSEAVAVDEHGNRVLLAPGSALRLVPGTRALQAAQSSQAQEQRRWLAAGNTPCFDAPFHEMVRTALLDMHLLTFGSGASVAGWSAAWRYVWPRDAAFVVAALARTGHPADAERILLFLQGVQQPDGRFEARYLPDGSGEPDARGIQLDGTGWVLWGAAVVARARALPGDRAGFLTRIRPLVDRATAAALASIDNPRSLPPVSPDYWETDEHRLTLGTAAPLLAGLRAAGDLYAALGDPESAARARAGALRLDAAITRHFGSRGYPRHIGGTARDAAITFLLPPFTNTVRPGVVRAWRRASEEMRRPAGGLAPGAEWRRDGVSWTSQTALFALTAAASGDRQTAQRWLAWLSAHRTRRGALPEKVLSDGSPAAVAPLAWTAALVVLTADELQHGRREPTAPACV